MENLTAQTEIHNAWANLVLADTYLAQGRHQDADTSMLDAQRHYRIARSAIKIKQPGPILENLQDLRIKLEQIRYAIKLQSGTLTRHARAGQ